MCTIIPGQDFVLWAMGMIACWIVSLLSQEVTEHSTAGAFVMGHVVGCVWF